MTVASVRVRIDTTRSSSALRTAKPDASSAMTSSLFARATPSMPPTRSVCADATLVTTPMLGRATVHSRAISPKPRMPISSTRASTSSGAFKMVTGRPWSLLKDRSFAATRKLDPSAAAIKSLVLVLPTEPVMPITRLLSCASSLFRPQAPSCNSAASVSGTVIAVRPNVLPVVKYAPAPAARAASTNS